MSTMLILLRQIGVMFCLVAVGYLLVKRRKISEEGSRTLVNIMLYCSLPCTIINGFLVERTPENIRRLLLGFALVAAVMVISMLLSRLIFRRDPMAEFASAFANTGFFGIPLVTGILGAEAAFYLCPYMVYINILQWTYGVARITGKKSFSLWEILKSPFVVAVAVSLLIFFSGIRLPELPARCIGFLASLNTPLAMFSIGFYLTQTDLAAMFRTKKLYAVSAVRLVLIPLCACALFLLLPAEMHDMRLALLIAAGCPVGSNIAVYAHVHGRDYAYAVQTVVISTLLCAVTLPLLAALTEIM